MAGKTQRPGWGCSLALVALLVGMVAALALLGPRTLALLTNQPPAAPALVEDRTSPAQMQAQREAAVARLESYGWVDQAANLAHIPIARAIALVAEQGLPVGVPTTVAAADQPATGAAAPADLPALDPAQIDFKRDVLPIFEQACTECHGFEEPEEGLVLTGYRSVMQGSNNGPVIVPGDPEKSYLVEQIVEGKMPKRGKKLTAEQIAIVTAWVEGGAREVAADQSATSASAASEITQTVAAPTPTVAPTATVAAVDPAQVDFKTDVLPIFEQYCTECHGFEEPEEGLVLTGYRSVMQGSNIGSVIEPGDPDKSLLIEMIVNGEMPKRGKKLTVEEIAIIIAWVQGGALEKAATASTNPAATLTPTVSVSATTAVVNTPTVPVTTTASAVTTPTATAIVTTAATSTTTIPTVDPATVSFQEDVLPIFEQYCTECHGFEEPEEGLVLTGYRSVMQGSNNGPVIEPGDPDKSYLIEQIVEGKMPKRGKKVTAEEVAIIIAWVKGGALNE